MIKNKQKRVEQKYVDLNIRAKKMKRENKLFVERERFITKSKPDIRSQPPSTPNKYLHQTIDSRSYIDKYSPGILKKQISPKRKDSKLEQSVYEPSNDSNTQLEGQSEQLLVQRARMFVSRLRNQKNHLKGLALLRKKQQQENKKRQQRLKIQERNQMQTLNQEYKVTKMMSNIMQHESRINTRLNMSLERVKNLTKRAKTQNSEQIQPYSQRLIDDKHSKILSLKQQIKNLQSKIRVLFND